MVTFVCLTLWRILPMTTRFLAAALLATTALLPVAALAGSDYGSMPVAGIATTAKSTTNTTTSTTVATTTSSTSSANAIAASLNETATSAGSDTKFYIEGRAGWSTLSEDDGEDDAIPFGGAIGYRLSPNVRTEAEVSYRSYDYPGIVSGTTYAGNGDESHLSAMLNGYYDFTNSSRFTPYLGAGIGFDRTAVDISYTDGVDTLTVDDNDIAFTYALMAGTSYAVNQNIDLTLGYRWFDTSKVSMSVIDTANGNYTENADTQAHEVLAGVRYNF